MLKTFLMNFTEKGGGGGGKKIKKKGGGGGGGNLDCGFDPYLTYLIAT